MKKKTTNNVDYTRYFIVLIILISLLLINEISNIAFFNRINDKLNVLEKCAQEGCYPPLPEWNDNEETH